MKQKIINILLERNKSTGGWKWVSRLELRLHFDTPKEFDRGLEELDSMIGKEIIERESINHPIYKLEDSYYK